MAETVVFLDIDGVLNNRDWRESVERDRLISVWSPEIARKMIDPSRVARLQRLCDACDAAVVIVAEWRRWSLPDEIAAVLCDAGLRALVLDAVGGLKLSGDLRCEATQWWLREHPETTRYVVLDDTASHWCCGGIVDSLVTPEDGLTDEDIKRALAVLAAQSERLRPSAVTVVPAAAETVTRVAPTDLEVIRRLAVALGYATDSAEVDVTLRAYRGPGERSLRKGHRSALLAVGNELFHDPCHYNSRSFLPADGETDDLAMRGLRNRLVRRLQENISEATRAAEANDRTAEHWASLARKMRAEAERLEAALREAQAEVTRG